jgi:hypothetical protein
MTGIARAAALDGQFASDGSPKETDVFKRK